MDVYSNEMIFYVGLIVAVASVILGVIYAIIYFVGKRRLNAKFDVEYGELQKNNRH